MKQIPASVNNQFKTLLAKNNIPQRERIHYLKWLRYYLDFCSKYNFSESDTQTLSRFIHKLKEKKQTVAQQNQSAKAIHLFYGFIQSQYDFTQKRAPQPHKIMGVQETLRQFQSSAHTKLRSSNMKPDSAPKKAERKSANQNWKSAFTDLEKEIKVRHYSPKTLKSYSTWVRKLYHHCKGKDPQILTPDDVKEFLTFLAVKRKVSASSQNQAFNALLFFFRHVLNQEFGKVDGVVRAKRRPSIPVVLSREEIDTIIANLNYPYDLVVKLLYGCGLRLFECLNLRIQSFNFDFGKLTVRDGKGKKIVPYRYRKQLRRISKGIWKRSKPCMTMTLKKGMPVPSCLI